MAESFITTDSSLMNKECDVVSQLSTSFNSIVIQI